MSIWYSSHSHHRRLEKLHTHDRLFIDDFVVLIIHFKENKCSLFEFSLDRFLRVFIIMMYR
jgi:hypothetical protein